ncbi:hypothetical protein BYT27DRAFT_7221222 [Phlegmacium glaucopus]|nr:hypothetical protein BYT27DRAFT_7221222 [Phlegmacium glaucopus]
MSPEADNLFVDNLPTYLVIEFRKSVFPDAFISKNPQIFLDNEWINVEKLKVFMAGRGSRHTAVPSHLVLKTEQVEAISVKPEPNVDTAMMTETCMVIDKEVIEILSDSEDEKIMQNVKKEPLPSVQNVKVVVKKKAMGKERENYAVRIPSSRSSDLEAFDPLKFVQESDTVWTDSEITSHRIDKPFQVTLELRVNRVEYLSEIPNVWPIPHVPTAFIDQDSWKGGTGTADSRARVCFQPGYPTVECRRSCLTCKGCYACSAVDPKLLKTKHYDLDPTTRSNILIAKHETRENERASIEQRAAIFLSVCRGKCTAINGNGKMCTGGPKMKEKSLDKQSRGRRYWIACSGWRKGFKKDHKAHSIPDDIDEDILAKLLNGTPLAGNTDTNPCSLFVAAHVGLKLWFCPHPHIENGVSLSHTEIKNYPCPARCTLYIPVDETLRFALRVYPGNIPHNHPMPRISKASFETKAAYRDCVHAAGTVGTTVQKVDQAASTNLLLGGQRPSQYNSSLYDARIKQEIIQDVKSKAHPAGLGLPGGTIIFTCIPFLLGLVHEVTSFECDVTFKCVLLLNEWEMVIYYLPVQRAITIARVYIDSANTAHYECLFDELHTLTESLTGSPLHFKRLSPGGNLLCMNADMEAAQVLGAGKSIMKTHDPDFSNIRVTTAEELLAFFLRLCFTHSKRAVLDFKGLVSAVNYQRIMDFPYIDSEEELESFTILVNALGIKKIKDWWTHKIKSKWIIPCILKSQSKILLEHWPLIPATTNIGESQHHWTNAISGIKLPLVDGIEATTSTPRTMYYLRSVPTAGTSPHTELFHRQTSTARKVRETAKIQSTTDTIQVRIEGKKEFRQHSLIVQHQCKEDLKALISSTGGTRQNMGVDLYNQTSKLRAKISKEKELRCKSNIIQQTLTAEKTSIAGSAASRRTVTKKGKLSLLPDTSSCGRVSAIHIVLTVLTLAGNGLSETALAGFIRSGVNEDAYAHWFWVSLSFLTQYFFCFPNSEKQEEEDDPDANTDDNAANFNLFSACEPPSDNISSFQQEDHTQMEPYLGSTLHDYYNSEPEDTSFSNIMACSTPFKVNVNIDSHFGHRYLSDSQVNTPNYPISSESEAYTPSDDWYGVYPDVLLPPVPGSSPPVDLLPANTLVDVEPMRVGREKRSLWAEFDKDNILPVDKRRKWVKTSHYLGSEK